MKRLHRFYFAGLIALAAPPALAAPRQYRGAQVLETFTKTLVSACGLVNGGAKYPALAGSTPDYDYIGGGTAVGGNALRDGTQDFAPMLRPLGQAEACDTDIPTGPQGEAALTISPAGSRQENWVVARDAAVVVTRQANAQRCDSNGITGEDGIEATADDFGASLAFDFTIPGTTTTLSNWKDVLRLLWAGALPADGNAQNAANRGSYNFPNAPIAGRCNRPERVALVAQWDNIIQHAAACTPVAGSCQTDAGAPLPLRHVFRADDAAQETGTFLSLLGLAEVGGSLSTGNLGTQQPFCNGTDSMDDDPIRVRCSINNPDTTAPLTGGALNDETCGADQTTGLVLAVRVPTLVGTTETNRFPPTQQELYPSTNCATGRFDIRRPPVELGAVRTCPDGAPYLFTGCLTPLPPPGSPDECRCVNAWTNRAPGTPDRNPSLPGLQSDGRIWNRILRGSFPPGRFGNPTNRCPVLRDERNVDNVLADFRLRYRAQTVSGLPVPTDRQCREADSTHAIGCLSRASDCSLGFATRAALLAREATTTPPQPAYSPATALLVGPPAIGGIPEGPSLAAIVASSPSFGYPLARSLYFSSLGGLASMLPLGQVVAELTGTGERFPTGPEASSPEQAQLVECLLSEDPDLATGPLQLALAASHLLPVGLASAAPFLDESVRRACP